MHSSKWAWQNDHAFGIDAAPNDFRYRTQYNDDDDYDHDVVVVDCVWTLPQKFMRRIATDFFNLQLNLCKKTLFCCICIPCSHKIQRERLK